MLTQISKISKKGCIKLPKAIRDAFGFLPETDVIIESMKNGIFIKPKADVKTITERIASMELPVCEWNQMEQEIEKEHLK